MARLKEKLKTAVELGHVGLDASFEVALHHVESAHPELKIDRAKIRPVKKIEAPSMPLQDVIDLNALPQE